MQRQNIPSYRAKKNSSALTRGNVKNKRDRRGSAPMAREALKFSYNIFNGVIPIPQIEVTDRWELVINSTPLREGGAGSKSPL